MILKGNIDFDLKVVAVHTISNKSNNQEAETSTNVQRSVKQDSYVIQQLYEYTVKVTCPNLLILVLEYLSLNTGKVIQYEVFSEDKSGILVPLNYSAIFSGRGHTKYLKIQIMEATYAQYAD